MDEWEQRVDDAYARFRTLAAERGVDPDRVDAAFTPEDAMLNPVRLRSDHGTVEWRAPDSALPDQIVRLAVDLRRLLAQTAEKPLVVVDDLDRCGVDADAIRIP